MRYLKLRLTRDEWQQVYGETIQLPVPLHVMQPLGMVGHFTEEQTHLLLNVCRDRIAQHQGNILFAKTRRAVEADIRLLELYRDVKEHIKAALRKELWVEAA